MSANPLDQFKIKPLVNFEIAGWDLSFTNSSLLMVVAICVLAVFFTASMSGRALVPGRFQSLAEIFYEFVADMLRDIVGSEGRRYFPFVFSLFMFILLANLLGMLPYSFTTTSHIIVTFAFAAVIFLGIIVISLINQGWKFFAHFLPDGTPLILAPLMIVIEVFAYLARPISLSVRLAANMVAGHVLLKVIAGFIGTFVATMGITGLLVGTVPLVFIVVLTGFEIFIAMLQAYIFTILTCVYLSDAVHTH